MSLASYGGAPLFGYGTRCTTELAERDAQVNTFFGLTGEEVIDGGGRGGSSRITGTYRAATPALLASQFDVLNSYQDNVFRTLVDTKGKPWPAVRLLRSGESGPVLQTIEGEFQQGFWADFRHAY